VTRPSLSLLLLAFFGVVVCFFLALPLLIIIPLSFTQSRAMQWPPVGFTTEWYQAVIGSSEWRDRLSASLKIGMGAAGLATVLGVPAALGLVRGRFPGKRLLSGLLLSPLVVPTVVIAIGMYFVWVLGWRIGPIAIGGNLAGSTLGLILAHTALTLPFPVIMVSAALVTVDRNLERAAATLGAGPVAVFRRVTAPLIRTGILFGFVFAFLGSWDEYIVASFLTSPRVTTVPVGLFSQIKYAIDPIAAAMSALLLAMSSLVLGLVLFRGGGQLVGEGLKR
jgi:putative spermidine/putrescine transport system permease protein